MTDKTKQLGLRNSARITAIQALYEMDVSGASVESVVNEFLTLRWYNAGDDGTDTSIEMPKFNADFLKELMVGVNAERDDFDKRINAALSPGWNMERIEMLLRAVLRAGTYELVRSIDVPARVVINEYVDIAKDFFSEKEPSLVNAVLDKIAKDVRIHEIKSDT